MESRKENFACLCPFQSHGYLNRIYFPHEKCVSERICKKIIFIKCVATPEGPKSENRNQPELKTASLYGMEATPRCNAFHTDRRYKHAIFTKLDATECSSTLATIKSENRT